MSPYSLNKLGSAEHGRRGRYRVYDGGIEHGLELKTQRIWGTFREVQMGAYGDVLASFMEALAV